MITITLDFETYYSKKEKYHLKTRNSGLTIEQYIRNPKFEVIGLAAKVNNRPTEFLAPHEIKDWLDHIEIAYDWDNVRAIAHNGRFDFAILGWVYGIYPEQLCDTMLMSRAMQLWEGNSLDNVTTQIHTQFGWGAYYTETGGLYCGDVSAIDDEYLLVKGTEVHDADGKHLADFTDEEYEAYAEYCKTDVDLTYSAYNFFKERGFPEQEIEVITATIETFTYPVLELDRNVLEEVDKNINEHRNNLLAKANISITDVRSDEKFANVLRSLGVEPPTKITDKGKEKYAFAKKDLDFLALLEHENPDVVQLVETRLGTKTSQAVTRVKSFIDLQTRGPMPIPLEYYAAHTGRWGGSDSINVQNLNRNKPVSKGTKQGTLVFYNGLADRLVKVLDDGKVYLARSGLVENDDEILHEVGLRDALKAPKGKVLIVLDWSQIELRFNAWLWGEHWILDTLVSGKDIYKVTAANTYGINYEEVNKSQRFVGKSQQLGLGYGAGVNGLKVVMGKRSEEFTDQELQSFVNSYRQSAPNIKRGWNHVKTAFNAMIQGLSVPLNDVNNLFYTDGATIVRPSGLRLTYPKIHHRQGTMGNEIWFWGKDPKSKKPAWEKTFGGKGDENGCQAGCRDVAAEKVVDIRRDFKRKKWSRDDVHIVMTVHDEIIACCKEELADEVEHVMRVRMTESKGWYATLPLEVDGGVAKRYGCAK